MYQITELILSVNSFWWLVVPLLNYHKDCISSTVLGYIMPHIFSTLMLTITDIVFVPMTCFAGKSHLYPMTCTAGMSFVSYVLLCRNQLHLRSAQEVQIRHTFDLPNAGKIFLFPCWSGPTGRLTPEEPIVGLTQEGKRHRA